MRGPLSRGYRVHSNVDNKPFSPQGYVSDHNPAMALVTKSLGRITLIGAEGRDRNIECARQSWEQGRSCLLGSVVFQTRMA